MLRYTIDATAKSVGRIASEAAGLLMGKNLATYKRNIIPNINLKIVHAANMKIDRARRAQKKYTRYTGYPSGQRILSQEQLIEKKGFGEVLRKAIYGMLPVNKLRARMLKNIDIVN